ncbi:MAG: hypothetical protein QHI48_12230 [Bacteroidota bacterium]|nr:hypothetical protein [Bacteroidota bacterium]
MFEPRIVGTVSKLFPNDQTLFQCILKLTLSIDAFADIQTGTLVAAENLSSKPRKPRYTVLQIVRSFPSEPGQKQEKGTMTLSCSTTPIGVELIEGGAKNPPLIAAADTIPLPGAVAHVLDAETTARVIHQIAPERRLKEGDTRIDIGSYAASAKVKVGLDMSTLVRGNIAIISARPRARTTMTTNLVSALLGCPSFPLHVVYCDVNNQGTMSLLPLLNASDNSMILCLNDKFVPASVFQAMRNPNDRSLHKRATLDYLDMMILPSVLEPRRHDFSYGVSALFRANKVCVYRPHEQTVDQFVNDIRIDILSGADAEAEGFLTGVMNGIMETYAGERFGEKNTRDILEMIDEFGRETKSHNARRLLYDLRTEIQGAYETYSKDIPAAFRKTIPDIVALLNDENRSSLLVVQGQKTADIMRFINVLAQSLIDERLKRLKTRVPVLFIFNNADEYVTRNGSSPREAGSERFQDLVQALITNGRRHGLGFCLTLESAMSLEKTLARRIGSYFVGPIPFADEPPQIAQLLNVSEELLRPAAHYEDGRFLFSSSDSPYHRRVPIPVSTATNTDVLHAYLDQLAAEAERKRKEYQAQEEERQRRIAQERTTRETKAVEPIPDREKTETEAPAAATEERTKEKHPPTRDRRGRRQRSDRQTRTSTTAQTKSGAESIETHPLPPQAEAETRDVREPTPVPIAAGDASGKPKRGRGSKHRSGRLTTGDTAAGSPQTDRSQEPPLTIETTRTGGYDLSHLPARPGEGEAKREPPPGASAPQGEATGQKKSELREPGKSPSRGGRGSRRRKQTP